MLTATDFQLRNVLHIACKHGLRRVCKYLVKFALEFGALNYMCAQEDTLGMVPFYRLAMRGFDAKSDRREVSRLEIIKLLITGSQANAEEVR